VVADLNDSFGWVDGSNEPPPFTVLDITILPCVKGA
jgi:hypothetical protein